MKVDTMTSGILPACRGEYILDVLAHLAISRMQSIITFLNIESFLMSVC